MLSWKKDQELDGHELYRAGDSNLGHMCAASSC